LGRGAGGLGRMGAGMTGSWGQDQGAEPLFRGVFEAFAFAVLDSDGAIVAGEEEGLGGSGELWFESLGVECEG